MKKRKWDPKTKTLIILQGLKGKPVSELCTEHQILPDGNLNSSAALDNDRKDMFFYQVCHVVLATLLHLNVRLTTIITSPEPCLLTLSRE